MEIGAGDTLLIERADDHAVSLIHLAGSSFFEALHQKFRF